MSKVTQYAIDDIKVCVWFSKVNLKKIQSLLQKILLEKKKKWEGEAKVEGILYYCKDIHQDVENSNQNTICFPSHPIPRNIRIL